MLHGLWNVGRVLRLEIGDRQSNFFNETTIRLGSDHLELDQDAFRGLEECGLVSRINENTRQDLVNDSDTVDLISKHVSQDVITRRIEQPLHNLLGSLRFYFLINNPQNGERGKLVRAQMGEVWSKARSQKFVTRRKIRRVQEPRK